jgi:hypothetical protein
VLKEEGSWSGTADDDVVVVVGGCLMISVNNKI